LRQRADVENKLETVQKLGTDIGEAADYFELGVAENDEGAMRDAEGQIAGIDGRLRRAELTRMLSGPVDHANAIVSINSGEGGTESKDWAAMLLRMYLRWCEQRGF
jgi:peptide chain release factor 2